MDRRMAVEVFDFLPYMMGDLEQRKPSGSSGLVSDFLIILGDLDHFCYLRLYKVLLLFISPSIPFNE